ncbi:magnesium transporter [Catenisphaera adipataccumulans]|jgi:magnesium transporter|uniref:Magnesium transporter MgtE n=1 Tax=Catenisphaera adipataccumulans TaxID=700500 RepID=A0A7W8CWT4_9FIRM|nr:magnesium transporter [Catenisphaera adipataccumulans]MBB5183057.1 magnesium transporter [Catenisphaera adipataccumulans]
MDIKEVLSSKEKFLAYYESVHPADIAAEIGEWEPEDLQKMCTYLSDEDLAEVLEQCDDDEREDIAGQVDDDRLVRLFEHMQKDDIADCIGLLPTARKKALMNRMTADDRRVIAKLLQYPEESAGGIMTTAYIALKETLSISQALQKIREIGPKTEVIETLYVINVHRQLVGTVDLRDLLAAPKDATVQSITDNDVISVHPEVDQEEVASLVAKYDLKSIPVVNARSAILGIITVDDIIDVIIDEYDEDILQMAGVSKEESIDTTLGESIRMRLPWLMINLATAFLASFTVKMFQSTIEQVVALSAVMTIVSGMGGNAGTQTMSILVRDLSHDEVHTKQAVRALIKEILLGIIDGASTGLVTAVIVYFMYGNFYLSLIVLLAMIGNLVIAGIFGLLIPLTLKKLNADPAIASSIFLTTATDVLGFFIFLGLATVFLQKLV